MTEESPKERLRRAAGPDVVPVELVGALAGDRPLTKAEHAFVRDCAESRSKLFYSDLLYAISHHYFAPEIAEQLWREVVLHKEKVSQTLGRNVGIVVATLDYFQNIHDTFQSPTLMAESEVSSLANLSMRDGLTGLYNHSTFYELLNLELENFRRYGVGLCLLLLDIDDFKLINDEFGHQAGDEVLVKLAKVLDSEARHADICFRLGGDEFALLMRFTNDVDQAKEVAERIARIAYQSTPKHRLSLSIGVALCRYPISTAEQLVQRADSALYRGKSEGKGRILLDDADLPIRT